jgi:pimeloyl-ACP methyl ester carboxylesterase
MGPEWEVIRSGPETAPHGVLLLPGGGCAASSYAAVMADPALAHLRLVAATLPGHAGSSPPVELSIEHYAALATSLAREHRCDVVVGFSMGASVALEMVASGRHRGPAVLLGISLSVDDEPGFFRAIVRSGPVLGDLPVALLIRLAALSSKKAHASAQTRRLIAQSLRKNDPHVLGPAMRAYLAYLGQHAAPADRLCTPGVPVWVAHAEKGDGGLTDRERETLAECPSVHLVTIPGSWFFLPEERPKEIAEIVAEAARASG